MKEKIKIILSFILSNWFKIAIILILLWFALSLSKIANHALQVDVGGNVDVDLCPEGSPFNPLIPTPSFCE